LTTADKYISATADLSIGSAQFELAGRFGVEKTWWGGSASTASFKASIPNFTIYGYNLGSAQILMDQSAYGASFSASLNVNLGIVNFGGEVSFHSVDDGIALSLDGYGSIGIENQWSAELHFHMSNCGNSECTKTGPLQLTAGGTAYLNSQAFNLGSISFDTGGHFKEQVSRSDEGCYNTGNIKPFGIEFDGCFSYTLFAQISDTAPYISLDADASINVDYRMRHYPCCKPNYWGSWHSIGSWSSGISVQLNPFKLSFSAKIIGIPVHFSI
jgi:hypothetical protein